MKDVYIRKPNDKERRLLESCPIWEHEPAQWDAEYDERCETCLIIEGTAVVSGRYWRKSVSIIYLIWIQTNIVLRHNGEQMNL